MFGSLKSFISSLVDDERARNGSPREGGRLATAALLIRVATIDSDMSAAKRNRLHAVLKSAFGLDDAATMRLIDDAAAADRSAVDLYHFTRQLNDALDDEGRRQVVRMMWDIVYVDGSVSEFEGNIVWRAADLLGVSSRQRVELRQAVAARRGAGAPAGFAYAAKPTA
jgi:uncharacterized tellurite resistance protein B-like protein